MGGSRKPYTVEEERSARGAASIGHAVIGRERVSVAIVALAMATTGTAAAVGRMLQTGAGVARREAYHAVRAVPGWYVGTYECCVLMASAVMMRCWVW